MESAEPLSVRPSPTAHWMKAYLLADQLSRTQFPDQEMPWWSCICFMPTIAEYFIKYACDMYNKCQQDIKNKLNGIMVNK